jgi:hypothetical protein
MAHLLHIYAQTICNHLVHWTPLRMPPRCKIYMNKNIVFDRVVGVQDSQRTGYLYKWLTKDRIVSHEMFVPARKLVTRNHICPACFIWRGQLVEMDDGQICPACKGKHTPEGCACGEVPHDLFCPMSPRNGHRKNG